jgi:hypothetical protein
MKITYIVAGLVQLESCHADIVQLSRLSGQCESVYNEHGPDDRPLEGVS